MRYLLASALLALSHLAFGANVTYSPIQGGSSSSGGGEQPYYGPAKTFGSSVTIKSDLGVYGNLNVSDPQNGANSITTLINSGAIGLNNVVSGGKALVVGQLNTMTAQSSEIIGVSNTAGNGGTTVGVLAVGNGNTIGATGGLSSAFAFGNTNIIEPSGDNFPGENFLFGNNSRIQARGSVLLTDYTGGVNVGVNDSFTASFAGGYNLIGGSVTIANSLTVGGATTFAGGNTVNGNLIVNGNITGTGNATANAFIGDGSQLTGFSGPLGQRVFYIAPNGTVSGVPNDLFSSLSAALSSATLLGFPAASTVTFVMMAGTYGEQGSIAGGSPTILQSNWRLFCYAGVTMNFAVTTPALAFAGPNTVDNCSISNTAGPGFLIQNSSGTTLRNVTITAANTYAIRNSSSSSTMLNVTATATTGNAMEIDGNAGPLVLGGVFNSIAGGNALRLNANAGGGIWIGTEFRGGLNQDTIVLQGGLNPAAPRFQSVGICAKTGQNMIGAVNPMVGSGPGIGSGEIFATNACTGGGGFSTNISTAVQFNFNGFINGIRIGSTVPANGGLLTATGPFAATWTNTLSASSITFAAGQAVYRVMTSSTTQGTVACSAGTGTLSSTCTDYHCTFLAGIGATSCTYTFGTPMPRVPDCLAGTDAAIPIAVSVTSPGTNSITITAAAALTGDNVSFHCMVAP